MSDAAIRELERAARSGDPQADERLLVARLRAGTIDRSRLELAAVCGDARAIRALGTDNTDNMPLPVILETVSRAMVYAPERDPVPWKEAGILAACAMVEVAQRHHHAARLGVFRVREPAHRPGRRVRAGALRRALRWTDGDREQAVETLDTCSDVTCDLSIRCVDAARTLVSSPATRRHDEELCFSLAQMGARGVEPGHGDFRRQTLHNLDWPAVPCAMAAHESGRPDLLSRLHERVRGLPFEAITPRGHNAERRLEADELVDAVKLDLELRSAVCSAMIAWALA